MVLVAVQQQRGRKRAMNGRNALKPRAPDVPILDAEWRRMRDQDIQIAAIEHAVGQQRPAIAHARARISTSVYWNGGPGR